MAVRTDHLVIYQGDDRPIQWPLLSADGQPLNVTGWSARAQVRHRVGSPVLHEWSTDNGRAVLAGNSVSLLTDDSEHWTWQSAVYDLFLIDPDGRHMVLAHGKVHLTPAVTRDDP